MLPYITVQYIHLQKNGSQVLKIIYSRTFFSDDWVELLHLEEFVYNNTINESIKQTPL